MEEIEQRIKEFADISTRESKETIEMDETVDTTVSVSDGSPVDVYQSRKNTAWERRDERTPHGSGCMVKLALKTVLPDLTRAYQDYNVNSEYLSNRGDKEKAMMLRTEYINNKFLPAVEAIIMQSSPDELLNYKEALKALDKLSGAAGQGDGFTAAYIRKAYDGIMGQQDGQSDDSTRQSVGEIIRLCDAGQIRSAYGLARKIKEQIDAGEHIASDADYAIISRVANIK